MKNEFDLTKIKTGDILVVSTDSWLANTIQWFQSIQNKEFGKYNHAMVAWWAYGKLFVTEAVQSGIVVTNFEEVYMKETKYKSILLLKPKYKVDGSKVGEYMLSYLGKTRYGFINLIFYQSIKFITGKWIGPLSEDGIHFICGQWAAHIANFSKENVIEDEEKVAPLDLCINTEFNHQIVKQL